MWWHAQAWTHHAQARNEVQTLQAQLGAASPEPMQTGQLALTEALEGLPSPEQQEHMWHHLQKVLAHYRVRLLSLQPVNEALLAPLPSQAMVMRLQARYENWAQVWQVLAQMGPVWSIDRLSVVHSTDAQGVDIEVVWRIWSRALDGESAQGKSPSAWPLPVLSDARSLLEGPSVFGLPTRSAPPLGPDAKQPSGVQVCAAARVWSDAAGAAEPLPQDLQFTQEPERLPMRALRLIGIWWQGQQAQAIVANGTHWFRAQEGQPLSLEGHRVWRIGGQEIQVRDPQGRIQTIRMEGKAP
jgi:hypothetical protein